MHATTGRRPHQKNDTVPPPLLVLAPLAAVSRPLAVP